MKHARGHYLKHPDRLRKMFHEHRYHSATRGIAFEFDYITWLVTWLASGHFWERGKRAHEYCMARFNDLGPYRADNVKIVTNAENGAEQKYSEERRAKFSMSLLGNTYMRGRKASSETRAKMSAARRAYLQRRAAVYAAFVHMDCIGY